jgi:predicted TIM-barrel fold metal-dependent hydrolase
MDEAGVEIALLSAWYGPEGDLVSNEEVAHQIEAAPTRFRGLASADLRQPMAAVREIRRWVNGKTFVGVRVVPWLWDLPPNDRRYYPIYAACIDARVPFCTQIGHTGPLCHVGFPWLDELVTLTVKFHNFHVDTSAYVLHRLPPAFVAWMKGIGKNRVMFGTNWPMLSPRKCLEGLNGLGLSQEQSEMFRSGNARRVFKL